MSHEQQHHPSPGTALPDADDVGGRVADPAQPSAVDTAPADSEAPEEVAAEEQPDWEALAAEDPRPAGELLAELTDAEARRDEYLEDVRRGRAELDNFRKRMMREGAGQRDAGRLQVVTRLLDVLDDFDRTLEAAQASADEGLAKGVELVYGKLVDTLAAQGLTRIDQVGVGFDPNRHEAVQRRDAEEARSEPVVAEVFRPGYEMNGRVLRAAMVVVEQ